MNETHGVAAQPHTDRRPRRSRTSLVVGALLGLALLAWGASSGVTWFMSGHSAESRDAERPARTIIRYSEENMSNYHKPSDEELQQQLTPEQYEVT